MIVYAKADDIIHIGRVGENKATTVAFDVTDWDKDWPGGTFNLLAEKDGVLAPKVGRLRTEGNTTYLDWEITNGDTNSVGLGKIMVDYRIGEVVVKSKIYHYIVTNSLDENETIEPEEYNWVEEIFNKAAQIDGNIKETEDKIEETQVLVSEAKEAKTGAETAQGEAETAKSEAVDAKDAAESAYGKVVNLLNSNYSFNGKEYESLIKAIDAATTELKSAQDTVAGDFMTNSDFEEIRNNGLFVIKSWTENSVDALTINENGEVIV